MATAATAAVAGFHPLADRQEWHSCEQVFGAWVRVPGNSACFECGDSLDLSSLWISVTHAVSLCPYCAGLHRALGCHLSRIKSAHLDYWSSEETRRVLLGGNVLCGRALVLPDNAPRARPGLDGLRKRYSSPTARDHCVELDQSSGTRLSESESPVAVDVRTRSHVQALVDRPGYFSTATGFGSNGSQSSTSGRPRSRMLSEFRKKYSASKIYPARALSYLSYSPAKNIFECAEAGDTEGVKWWVLNGGAAVDQVDELGWSPLLYAVKFDRPCVCSVLLGLADSSRELAEAPECGGLAWSPLQWAASTGHGKCAEILLDAGASPNGVPCGKSSKSPLRLANYAKGNKRAGANHQQVIELLFGFGADTEGYYSSEYAEGVRRRFSWIRRRRLFWIRDKAQATRDNDIKLQMLLSQRPWFFFKVLAFL